MAVNVMNRTISRAAIALTLVVGLVASVAPANALGTPKAQAAISWAWQDGADRVHRDFAEEDYDMITDMPMVRVLVTPPSVSRRVILDEFDELSGEWVLSYSGRTDATGVWHFCRSTHCASGISEPHQPGVITMSPTASAFYAQELRSL